MGLFKKQKTKAAAPAGRRRPVATSQASQPSQAFSYYAQRKTPQANTGRGQMVESINDTKDGRHTPNRVVAVGGVILAIVVILAALNLSTSPKIVTVASQNGSSSFLLHSTTEYQAAAAEALNGSIFSHNKLTVDTANVRRQLIAKYPELHAVNVQVPLFGSRPVVYIMPYQPAFVLSTLDNQAFVIDEAGRALAPTSQISNLEELGLPTVEDKSGMSIERGAQALPADTVSFVRTVMDILDAAKVRHQSLVLPAATSELDVYISGAPYFVKFNLQGDPRLQAGTYLAAKGRLEKDKVTPGQYIDVRVPERAYYK